MQILALSILSSALGHSFLDTVGAFGAMRGGNLLSDSEKQRYFCPLRSLDLCQPPEKNEIVLTQDSMRPCRTDDPKSHPVGRAIGGQPLYLHWAGNGHTAVNGTCVRVAIAPYAADPNMEDFRTLEECLPFARGPQRLTDANVTIPANLVSGEYTLFWLWDFAPFWFSSCADIFISDGSVSPVISSLDQIYTTYGCSTAAVPIKFCQDRFGQSSYCKGWASDECGRARCHLDTLTTDFTTCSTSTTSIPTLMPRRPDYRAAGCGSLPVDFCPSVFGGKSYCKTWQKDSCGRSACHGSPVFTRLGNC